MGTIVNIIGAIKGIASIVKIISNAYLKYQERQIEKHYEHKIKVLEKLIARAENATTDEERAEIARRLANIM